MKTSLAEPSGLYKFDIILAYLKPTLLLKPSLFDSLFPSRKDYIGKCTIQAIANIESVIVLTYFPKGFKT